MVVKSKVKYINSLGQKKHRDAEGVFVAEGPKIINELLAEPAMELVEIFATKEWINENVNVSLPELVEVDDVMLERLSFLTTPNQVLGVFKKPALSKPDLINKLTIVADNIQDPGNLGTIIRSADWFGVEQVICSIDCADIYNPKAVQSTMGSIARVKVYYDDLPSLIASNLNIKVFAASLEGKDISEVKPSKEAMIVIGNESKGIRNDVLSLVKEKITIPRRGRAESLNAAVATGIILFYLTSEK